MKHCVYLIRCNQYYKIGISSNIDGRLRQIDTGIPYEIILEHCMYGDRRTCVELESALHRKFYKKRKKGEWFSLYKDDIDYIKSKPRYILNSKSIFLNSDKSDGAKFDLKNIVRNSLKKRKTSITIGIYESELIEFMNIAADINLSVHDMIKCAISAFIKLSKDENFTAGDFEEETELMIPEEYEKDILDHIAGSKIMRERRNNERQSTKV